jgi:hypothetical protein
MKSFICLKIGLSRINKDSVKVKEKWGTSSGELAYLSPFGHSVYHVDR